MIIIRKANRKEIKNMSVSVRIIDMNGNTLKVFPSVTKAAKELGVTTATMTWRIRSCSVFNGCIAEYVEKKITPEEEESIAVWREKAYMKHRKPKEERECDSRGLDDMNEIQFKQIKEEHAKKGLTLEEVSYKLWNGIKSITPCRRRENRDFMDWPMIGSLNCIQCRYFKGRSRKKRVVLCSYWTKIGKERMERRERKETE